jgi:hypothetical protein
LSPGHNSHHQGRNLHKQGPMLVERREGTKKVRPVR